MCVCAFMYVCLYVCIKYMCVCVYTECLSPVFSIIVILIHLSSSVHYCFVILLYTCNLYVCVCVCVCVCVWACMHVCVPSVGRCYNWQQSGSSRQTGLQQQIRASSNVVPIKTTPVYLHLNKTLRLSHPSVCHPPLLSLF